MNQYFLKKYIEKKTEQTIMKTEHVCNNCKKTTLPVRRISVLNILFYLIIGVGIGYFVRWWLGFIVGFACLWINVKKSKKQCKHCYSTDIYIPKQQFDDAEHANHNQ